MAYSIETFGARVVGTVFRGSVEMHERLSALEALNLALEDSGAKAVLIDMSQAAMGEYSASDALKFADAINRKKKPLRPVAYVLRPSQSDVLATVMAGVHGRNTFRRFEDRETALAWLSQDRQLARA